MSATPPLQTDKVTVPNLLNRKRKGGKIVCLTAYDYPFARILDQAGIDLVLVGDSLATTRMGHDSTLPLRVKDVLRHLKAVRRGLQRALLVADLPYGSYHLSAKEALRAALKFIKAGAEAVKIEGGSRRSRLVKRLVRAEIPVMGHVGLTPQSLHVMGGYRVQGKNPESAEAVMADALALQEAGAFAVVLEGVPEALAFQVTHELRIPTIGIGAGPHCDGQILVCDDLFGLSFSRKPRFVRQYADLREILSQATRHYISDCLSGDFPSRKETYYPAEFPRLEEALKR
ncbi:MAG: 3-methyl-2-oxobutanoate hydroxymethyltransferase [Acidobacteriota bacterium]|nr:3-methyl-2-oxobutanoate hydroxymethyltransferase [Acidobacteriota bacterium]